MTVTRARNYARVKAYSDLGYTQKETAEVTGLSRSYISCLLTDPDGSKDRARKEGYGGRCEVCGKRTSGSNGAELAPRRCTLHAQDKYWKAETVVHAIQEWNRRRGQPPRAREWIRKIIDPDGYRFPPRTSCCRSTDDRNSSPFASWADAIEAAGFQRPQVGAYAKTPEHRRAISARMRGRVVSQETRRKISEAQKRRWSEGRYDVRNPGVRARTQGGNS